MPTEVDPAGIEPRTILEAADFDRARVLEVGAGDGRLTFRYAAIPASVVGIDTDETEIRSTVQVSRRRVHFLCANATAVPFSPDSFDIVLLASSLWWVPQEGMVDALREVRRVLRPNGVLIDVRPLTAPLVMEVLIDGRPHWAIEVDSSVGAEDDAAAEAAVHHAVSHEWFAFESRQPFDFEILLRLRRGIESVRATASKNAGDADSLWRTRRAAARGQWPTSGLAMPEIVDAVQLSQTVKVADWYTDQLASGARYQGYNTSEVPMRFEKFSFGSIRIDGVTYKHDVVIDRRGS